MTAYAPCAAQPLTCGPRGSVRTAIIQLRTMQKIAQSLECLPVGDELQLVQTRPAEPKFAGCAGQ
jgi:hypothetical protein